MNHGWEKKKLGEVCDIYQPKTISTKDLVKDGEYDVFGANGIIGKYTNYNHEDPEVLLTCRGATCGTINISNPKSWINGNAMVIHPKSNGLSKSYLRIILQSVDYTNVITGAAQPQITRTSISPVEIQIPSIEQQCQIVSELDKLNELIELKRNQFKDLDTLAQSLFYETFGDPIENPKGWVRYPLNLLIQPKINIKRASKTFKSKDIIEYVDISAIDRMTKSIKSSTEMKFEDAPSRAQQVLENGDVLISLVRPNLQNIAVNHIDRTNIVGSSGFCVIRPVQNASNTFLMYLLLTRSATEYLCKKASGASYPAITEDILRNMQIIVPPVELQNEFAAKIEAIEKQKRLIESSISDLETLLASRMDYWFND